MNLVIIGLSITSSWGNGHATTYRSLVKGLNKRGNKVLFLERDVPWYASNRDLPSPDYCRVRFYNSVNQLKEYYSDDIENADAVIVGSYVPDGIEAGKFVIRRARGVKAFYDIDAPVTIAKLRKKNCEYISANMIPLYDLYLSFSAGTSLDIFEAEFGSPDPQPLYCSVDPEIYHPVKTQKKYDLGYLGTFSVDRQIALTNMLIQPARQMSSGKFIVAGPQYPDSLKWPSNVERINHLPPGDHSEFYGSQRYTLNVTRKDMINLGYSPSIRLFEAAACGVPVISDYWQGIYSIFDPGKEILIASSAHEVISYLTGIPARRRKQIGENARKKILEFHTGEHRAMQLENYIAANRIKIKKKAGYVLT